MPSASNWMELRLKKNAMKKKTESPDVNKHLLSCLLFSENFISFLFLQITIKIENLINFSFFFLFNFILHLYSIDSSTHPMIYEFKAN